MKGPDSLGTQSEQTGDRRANSSARTTRGGVARRAASRDTSTSPIEIPIPYPTGRGQDLIRYPAKTGEKLVYLLNDIGSTDNAPTASQAEVGGVLRQRARAARDELDRIIQRDLDQFNRMLREKGMGGIFARVEPPKVP